MPNTDVEEVNNSLVVNKPPKQTLVGIVMGSDSDLSTMAAAAAFLEDELGVAVEVTILSAHRTPDRVRDYALSAYSKGVRVIIAGAGGAAHLPGMLAAHTPLPIIGVPVVPDSAIVKDGSDATPSIQQMPSGVPVATMAVGGAKNAGIFAAQILATSDVALFQKLLGIKEKMKAEVEAKATKLETLGWRGFMAEKKRNDMLPKFGSTPLPALLPQQPANEVAKVSGVADVTIASASVPGAAKLDMSKSS